MQIKMLLRDQIVDGVLGNKKNTESQAFWSRYALHLHLPLAWLLLCSVKLNLWWLINWTILCSYCKITLLCLRNYWFDGSPFCNLIIQVLSEDENSVKTMFRREKLNLNLARQNQPGWISWKQRSTVQETRGSFWSFSCSRNKARICTRSRRSYTMVSLGQGLKWN